MYITVMKNTVDEDEDCVDENDASGDDVQRAAGCTKNIDGTNLAALYVVCAARVSPACLIPHE